jgi:hypothetical protein
LKLNAQGACALGSLRKSSPSLQADRAFWKMNSPMQQASPDLPKLLMRDDDGASLLSLSIEVSDSRKNRCHEHAGASSRSTPF